MNKYAFIISILFSLNITAQNLQELESDLTQTDILDTKQIKIKSDRIFEIDPFNFKATLFLIESYDMTGQDSLIERHFDNLKREHLHNYQPYFLSAIFQYKISVKDTSRLKDLKRAYFLEPKNLQVNKLLGESYYYLFNESIQSDSLPKPLYDAEQSRFFFKEVINLDSVNGPFLKYPVIQLSSFLEDPQQVETYSNLKTDHKVNDNDIPQEGQLYFPVDMMIDLDEGWENSYEISAYTHAEIAKSHVEYSSKYLFIFREPLLFNQLQDTVYRLTWLRSFHRPIVVRIQKNGEDIVLTYKSFSNKVKDSTEQIFKNNIQLTNAQWEEFQSLLKEADYWNMPTNEPLEKMGTDGSTWIIEGIENGRYHVVDRWTPRKNAFYELGRFVIKLTDLKNQIGEFIEISTRTARQDGA